MKIYRTYLALLFGVALTAVYRTMLGATSRLGAAGLWPGATVSRLTLGTNAPGWAALACNVALYSLVGGLLVWRLTRNRSAAELRQMAAFATLLLPVFFEFRDPERRCAGFTAEGCRVLARVRGRRRSFHACCRVANVGADESCGFGKCTDCRAWARRRRDAGAGG